jgi:hypothetical protein
MKKLLAAMAISAALTLLVLPLAYGQGAPAPPAQAPQDKVFQGQLTKIDATAKSLSVKGADMEMTFEWTDATQVTGSEKTIQGLAGKTGSDLRVTYRDAAGKHTATKIETIEKK